MSSRRAHKPAEKKPGQLDNSTVHQALIRSPCPSNIRTPNARHNALQHKSYHTNNWHPQNTTAGTPVTQMISSTKGKETSPQAQHVQSSSQLPSEQTGESDSIFAHIMLSYEFRNDIQKLQHNIFKETFLHTTFTS
ncbi:MAG TPA: hypothetical protein DCE42_09010 [Myxococcales bacterium]|nr:hypothetical protein [Deltaproteobacteria bacterium]MBU50496.1 hypothetical protein [Deltaproteobacteria bacterium]HAA54885.1 hypothetical protein [Myxococcales bacterium]